MSVSTSLRPPLKAGCHTKAATPAASVSTASDGPGAGAGERRRHRSRRPAEASTRACSLPWATTLTRDGPARAVDRDPHELGHRHPLGRHLLPVAAEQAQRGSRRELGERVLHGAGAREGVTGGVPLHLRRDAQPSAHDDGDVDGGARVVEALGGQRLGRGAGGVERPPHGRDTVGSGRDDSACGRRPRDLLAQRAAGRGEADRRTLHRQAAVAHDHPHRCAELVAGHRLLAVAPDEVDGDEAGQRREEVAAVGLERPRRAGAGEDAERCVVVHGADGRAGRRGRGIPRPVERALTGARAVGEPGGAGRHEPVVADARRAARGEGHRDAALEVGRAGRQRARSAVPAAHDRRAPEGGHARRGAGEPVDVDDEVDDRPDPGQEAGQPAQLAVGARDLDEVALPDAQLLVAPDAVERQRGVHAGLGRHADLHESGCDRAVLARPHEARLRGDASRSRRGRAGSRAAGSPRPT